MNTTELQELSKHIHEVNLKWWQDLTTGAPISRNPRELLMLVISEISEAMEGERKDLMDDKLPHRKMAEVEMADAYIRLLDFSFGLGYPVIYKDPCLPDSEWSKPEALFKICTQVGFLDDFLQPWWHVELVRTGIASVLSKIEGYCIKHGYDLWGAIDEKAEYNRHREDHTHEARKAANGKKF